MTETIFDSKHELVNLAKVKGQTHLGPGLHPDMDLVQICSTRLHLHFSLHLEPEAGSDPRGDLVAPGPVRDSPDSGPGFAVNLVPPQCWTARRPTGDLRNRLPSSAVDRRSPVEPRTHTEARLWFLFKTKLLSSDPKVTRKGYTGLGH